MASFTPPAYNSDVFDSGLFNIGTETLTLEVADARYFKLAGGTVLGYSTFAAGINVIGSLIWNGVAVDLTGLTYLSAVTPGTVTASKAIVVDSNKDISAFRNLTATSITGTLQTAAQPNITSIGTLASLTATSITGTLQTAAQTNITSVGTLTSITTSGALTMGTTVISEAEIGVLDGVTPGTVSASKAVVVDSNKDISAFRNLTAIGTITSLVSIATTMTCNGIDIGSNLSPLVGVTAGTCTASKALVVDSSKNIIGLNVLRMDSDLYMSQSAVLRICRDVTTGDLNSTIYSDGIASLCLSSIRGGGQVKVLTNANSSNNCFSINNAASGTNHLTMRADSKTGLYTNTPGYGLDVQSSLNCTSLYLNGTQMTATATELNVLAGITAGAAAASKAMVLNAASDIVAVRNLSMTGNLVASTSVTTASLVLGGNTLGATQSGYLTSITAGTAAASKAVVLDSSENISGINSLTSNYLVCNTAINGSNALGTMKALNLGGIVLDYGVMSLKGSGTKPSVSFGSTNSLLWMESSHGTPIEAEINVSSGTSSTSTNALRMGSCSNNDFNLFTNNTERVVIRAGGEVLIKRFLQVGDSTDTSRMISCLDNTMTAGTSRYLTLGKQNASGDQAEIAFRYVSANDDTNALTLGFYGGEKARLTRWGSLLVNSTQNTYSATKTKFAAEAAGATEWTAVFVNTSASNNKCMGFINNSSLEVGSITWGTGTTSFNTTSDYRLKKDVEPMTDGLELINRLNPVRYKWINSEESAEGFIAHELQDVLPHCVQGQRDAVYPDGSVNPQSVDYGKLTTTLVAAIQDLSAENQSLKARLERLEQLSESDNNSVDIDIVEVSPENKFALKKTKRSNV